MSFRAGLRPVASLQPFRATFKHNAQQRNFTQHFRQKFGKGGRRWQSTTAGEGAQGAKKENRNPFDLNSPVGPKTVHFWYVTSACFSISHG
jgi:hypothetical protein